MGDAGRRDAGRLDDHLDALVEAELGARGRTNRVRAMRAASQPTLAAGGLARARDRDRRSPRPPARRSSAPGRGTSSRTCRRRSARRAPAFRRRRAAAAGDADSSSYSAAAVRRPRERGVGQQRVVGDRLDRREVAMRDPFRPGRLADVVRDGAQRQIDDPARIGRDVRAARRARDCRGTSAPSRACRSARRCRPRSTSRVTVSLSSVHSG